MFYWIQDQDQDQDLQIPEFWSGMLSMCHTKKASEDLIPQCGEPQHKDIVIIFIR